MNGAFEELTIDEAGNFTVQVHGVAGKTCESLQEKYRETGEQLAGGYRTDDYYKGTAQTTVQSNVRSRS
jgi:hypothetical protein